MSSCRPVPGWHTFSSQTTDAAILFGEMHGTMEIPRFVVDAACHEAIGGQKVLIGIETWTDDQPDLDHGFELDDDGQYWAENLRLFTDTGDGRHGKGMLDLLLAVRTMKQSGLDIDVVALAPATSQIDKFEGVVLGDYQSRRFAAEAENIERARAAAPGARMLVLHGNVHAMRTGLQVDEDRKPLFDQSSFVRLNFTADGGSGWFCSGSCGVHEINRSERRMTEAAKRGVAIRLDPHFDPPFDGWYAIGTATPSYPIDLTAADKSVD